MHLHGSETGNREQRPPAIVAEVGGASTSVIATAQPSNCVQEVELEGALPDHRHDLNPECPDVNAKRLEQIKEARRTCEVLTRTAADGSQIHLCIAANQTAVNSETDQALARLQAIADRTIIWGVDTDLDSVSSRLEGKLTAALALSLLPLALISKSGLVESIEKQTRQRAKKDPDKVVLVHPEACDRFEVRANRAFENGFFTSALYAIPQLLAVNMLSKFLNPAWTLGLCAVPHSFATLVSLTCFATGMLNYGRGHENLSDVSVQQNGKMLKSFGAMMCNFWWCAHLLEMANSNFLIGGLGAILLGWRLESEPVKEEKRCRNDAERMRNLRQVCSAAAMQSEEVDGPGDREGVNSAVRDKIVLLVFPGEEYKALLEKLTRDGWASTLYR